MENNQTNNPSRSELISDFVKSNPDYYIKEFKKIGSRPSFSLSFNLYASILGPVWFGMSISNSRNKIILNFIHYSDFLSLSGVIP